MDRLQALVVSVRNARNLLGIADGIAVAATVATPDAGTATAFDSERAFLIDRANLSELTIAANATKPAQSVTTVVGASKVHIPVSGLADLGKLKAQLEKRAATLEKSIAGKQSKLGNADYIARAPAEQVAETKGLLATEQVELANVRETIAGL
ncbi:MAG: hypothetical protein AAB263_12780, partial [Planctomycetota bacterium]